MNDELQPIGLDEVCNISFLRGIIMDNLRLYEKEYNKLDFDKRITNISYSIEKELWIVKKQYLKAMGKNKVLHAKNKELKDLLETDQVYKKLKERQETVGKLFGALTYEEESHESALEKIKELKIKIANLEDIIKRQEKLLRAKYGKDLPIRLKKGVQSVTILKAQVIPETANVTN